MLLFVWTASTAGAIATVAFDWAEVVAIAAEPLLRDGSCGASPAPPRAMLLTALAAAGDLGTVAASFAIPAVLCAHCCRIRREVRPLALLLAAFVLCCGGGQLLATGSLGDPLGWAVGLWKLATAAVGLAAAIALFRQAPHLFDAHEALECARAALASDWLTGLANRRSFDATLARVETGLGRGFVGVLVLVDLDDFKRANDTYGHPAGDGVLRGVAEILQGLLPEAVCAARIGGDEFAAILPGMGLAAARSRAERVQMAIAALRLPGLPDETLVTASIGLAEISREFSAMTAYERADRLLYAAKYSGKGRVCG